MIWEQIQRAKQGEANLHVVWLDQMNRCPTNSQFFHAPSTISVSDI